VAPNAKVQVPDATGIQAHQSTKTSSIRKIQSPCFGANPRAKQLNQKNHLLNQKLLPDRSQDSANVIDFASAEQKKQINFGNLQQFIKFTNSNSV
jgi:hypothetical protein